MYRSCTKIKELHFYSCCAPPSDSPEQFADMLGKLVDHASGCRPTVIGDDFNAWATEWGSPTSNQRGRAVIEAMNLLDLVLLNDGLKPTFNNDRGSTFVSRVFGERELDGARRHIAKRS